MGGRIVIVEDDPQSMYLARFLLERRGHEVVPALDGEAALDAVREQRPDLVLMDMHLPKMDGYEATRRLRREFGPSLPIVALTAHSMKGDRESTIDAGCDGYISKPIDPERFTDEVEAYMEGGRE